MSARGYLAWNMLVAAEFEDQRRLQREFQAKMRIELKVEIYLSMNPTNSWNCKTLVFIVKQYK